MNNSDVNDRMNWIPSGKDKGEDRHFLKNVEHNSCDFVVFTTQLCTQAIMYSSNVI